MAELTTNGLKLELNTARVSQTSESPSQYLRYPNLPLLMPITRVEMNLGKNYLWCETWIALNRSHDEDRCATMKRFQPILRQWKIYELRKLNKLVLLFHSWPISSFLLGILNEIFFWINEETSWWIFHCNSNPIYWAALIVISKRLLSLQR